MMRKGIHILFMLFATIPWLFWRLSSLIVNKNEAFQGASQFCALFPGKLGTLFRAAFYRLSLENTSQRTSIAFLTTFSNTKASLAEHVSIGTLCNIGNAEIGKNTILASQVCITSGKNQHSYEDVNTPIRMQESNFTTVKIGADCWIGAGAIIMANVGDGCIVAAGSVVTKDIPSYSVVAGVPAKVLESRLEQKSSHTDQKQSPQ